MDPFTFSSHAHRPHFFVPQWAPPLMASPPTPHGADLQAPPLRDRSEPPQVKHTVKLGKKSGTGSRNGKKAEQNIEESLIVSGKSSQVELSHWLAGESSSTGQSVDWILLGLLFCLVCHVTYHMTCHMTALACSFLSSSSSWQLVTLKLPLSLYMLSAATSLPSEWSLFS